MSCNIIEKLFSSLTQLEEAIIQTKESVSLLSAGRPEILQRLACYEEVLKKQKTLAVNLQQHVDRQDWEQVTRFVELIRGSSLLIQLDTQSIIAGLQSNDTSSASEDFCD